MGLTTQPYRAVAVLPMAFTDEAAYIEVLPRIFHMLGRDRSDYKSRVDVHKGLQGSVYEFKQY